MPPAANPVLGEDITIDTSRQYFFDIQSNQSNFLHAHECSLTLRLPHGAWFPSEYEPVEDSSSRKETLGLILALEEFSPMSLEVGQVPLFIPQPYFVSRHFKTQVVPAMVFLGKLCIIPRLNPLERVYPAAGRASQLFLYSQMVRKTPPLFAKQP